MNNIIDVCFVGKDYSNLESAAERANISIEGKELSKEQKLDILKIFLKNIQDDVDSLIIGTSSYESKKQNEPHKIYDPKFNDKIFSGVVGVVSKVIGISKGELKLDETDDTFDEMYYFNVKLQIHSRLDVDEKDEISKPFFLSTMLLQSFVKLNDDTIPNDEEELFDYLLLFWFKEQLQTAYLKGFYRTYRKFENNDNHLRGSIDIARHIRLNMGQDNGRIAYSYRENTVNNYLNHLIVIAYKHLKKKYYDLVAENFDSILELKAILDNLMIEIGYFDDNVDKLILKNLKAINHPFYTEYEELRKTCMKILRNEAASLFDGEMDQETKGILFYLPDLWEEYVGNSILSSVNNINVDDPEIVIQVKTQVEQKIFGTKEDSGYKYHQSTYPDYVFAAETTNGISSFMILDAKFKPKWEGVLEGTTTISEVLYDYDKCLRDMVSINAHATGVIFPYRQKDLEKDILDIYGFNLEHTICKENEIDRFYTMPIPIPYISKEENYLTWKNKLEKNVEMAKSSLKGIVEKEYTYRSKVFMLEKEMRKIRMEQ